MGITFWNSRCQCFVCLWGSLSEILCANVLFACWYHLLKFYVPMFCLPVGITFWNSTQCCLPRAITFWNSMCQYFVCLCISHSEILHANVLFAYGYHLLKSYKPMFCLFVGITFWNSIRQYFVLLWINQRNFFCWSPQLYGLFMILSGKRSTKSNLYGLSINEIMIKLFPICKN